MAFMMKNQSKAVGSTGPQTSIVDQYVKVQQAASDGSGITLPATTTGQLFRVKGGRVLVKALIGEVTTATDATATNLKVSVKKLTAAGAAVGTAVDIAANVAVASQEVGAHIFVEGDGTAAVVSTAGGVLIGPNSGWWIVEQGEIYITTSATNAGKAKWDLYYQPLDPGAYVEAATLTGGLLTAAI